MANNKTKIIKLVFLLFILFLITGILINSVDFSPVDLTPDNATTENNLQCLWNFTLGAKVNVTWYNGSNQYNETKINVTNVQNLPAFIAKKGQTWNCTVVEWNDSANIWSDSVEIRNANPYPPDVQNDTLIEDIEWSKNLFAGDPDGDSINAYLCLPDYFDINDEETIIWTPLSEDVEPETSKLYNFTCVVFDSENAVSSKTFSLNVTAVNDFPEFIFPSPKNSTVNETQKLQYLITLADEENPTGLFNLSFNNTEINCPYNSSEKFELNRTSNFTFILQMINNQSLTYQEVGNCTINLRVLDPRDALRYTDDTFNLEILSVNHPPNITHIESKGRNYSQGEDFTLLINATDIDPEDYLSFSVFNPNCDPNPWNTTVLVDNLEGSALLNATPINDSHIKCKTITILVVDSRNGTASENITLNLTNINDAPVIHELSYYNNTNENVNLTNLTAYASVPFIYIINATDSDIFYQTDTSDFLTYGSNSSYCNSNCPTLTVNTTTGAISFLPNNTYADQNYTYKINVTDKYNLIDNKTIFITVIRNNIPYFNQTPPNITAYEDVLFTIQINATDVEDKQVTFSDNSTVFNITETGLIEFTPTCFEIGNYSTKLTINDSFGAENESIFNLEIVMVPDTPIMPVLSNITLFESQTFSMTIAATDEDLTCGQVDNLTYSYDFLYGSLSNFNLENTNNIAIVSFISSIPSQGNYLINFTVEDLYNEKSSALWNLTIINRSNPPIINNVTPYGSPFLTTWSSEWINVSLLGDDFTNLNISEDSLVYYDHNSSDVDKNSLVFNWTVNGDVVSSNRNISIYWDYESSGIYNITLTVSDIVNNTQANWVSFSWNTTISNLNRAPKLNFTLSNVTVNKTETKTNYLICGNYINAICNETRFYDPDEDTLNYNYTNTTKVAISITGNTVTFTGIELGNETVIFTASDGHLTNVSNNITIFVLELPEEEEDENEGDSDSSGRNVNYVPYSITQEVEKEKEIYLDILVPEPVTIYQNDTLREVIGIVNTGNTTLRGILLYAETNQSNANISFSNNYFSELLPGETKKTDLIITAFKLMNHYEIVIWANVSEPKYRDKAIVYVNAIEKSKGNQSIVATKITFAQDLLNSNPECLELNEFLKKSQNLMEQKEYDEAAKIVDSVIQGCKYLVSRSKLRDESPRGIFLGIDFSNRYLIFALVLFLLIIIGVTILTIKLKKSNEKEQQ